MRRKPKCACGSCQQSFYGQVDGLDMCKAHYMQAADRIEALEAALNYVADMTYCGADAEWHFKPNYDPQLVLDALI